MRPKSRRSATAAEIYGWSSQEGKVVVYRLRPVPMARKRACPMERQQRPLSGKFWRIPLRYARAYFSSRTPGSSPVGALQLQHPLPASALSHPGHPPAEQGGWRARAKPRKPMCVSAAAREAEKRKLFSAPCFYLNKPSGSIGSRQTQTHGHTNTKSK